MSIFGDIKNAIFGGGSAPAAPAPAPAPEAAAPAAAPPPPPPPPPAAADPAAIEATLAQKAAAKGITLDYQHSIVDLMKTLDLDPSLSNREALAKELGYTGALDGSAEMNIWLHKAVMDELTNGKR